MYKKLSRGYRIYCYGDAEIHDPVHYNVGITQCFAITISAQALSMTVVQVGLHFLT